MLYVYKFGGAFRFACFALIVLVVSAFGCGVDEPQESQNTPDRPLLDCEKYDFPCVLGEEHMPRYHESLELGDEVYERYLQGVSKDEITSWLEDMEGMDAVYYSDIGVGFRLEGTRAVHVMFESPMTLSTEEVSSSARQSNYLGGAVPVPLTVDDFNKRVVGQQRGEPEPKYALVLSPFESVFKDAPSSYINGYDSGDQGKWVRDFLVGTMRGYSANTVTYLENEAVDLNSFRGWGGYDVIHVMAHGYSSCWVEEKTGESLCDNWIYTGVELEEGQDIDEVPGYGEGVEVGIYRGKRFAMLNANFFKANYLDDLRDTFVFLNACYSARGDGGLGALEDTFSMLGWTEQVETNYANLVAISFYGLVHEYGYSVGNTLAIMRDARMDDGRKFVEYVNQKGHQAMFARIGQKNLRIREVITLERENGQRYQPGDGVPFIPGTESKPASTMIQAKVEGLKRNEGDVVLDFFVDGVKVASDNVFNPRSAQVKALEKDAYYMTIEVPLDSFGPDTDVSKDVRLEVQAHLPNGGLSRYKVSNIYYPGNRVNAAFDVSGLVNGYKHGFVAIVRSDSALTLSIHDSEQITEGEATYSIKLMMFNADGSRPEALSVGTYTIGGPGGAHFHPVFTDLTSGGLSGVEYTEFDVDSVVGALVVEEVTESGHVFGKFEFEAFRYIDGLEKTGDAIFVSKGVFYANTAE